MEWLAGLGYALCWCAAGTFTLWSVVCAKSKEDRVRVFIRLVLSLLGGVCASFFGSGFFDRLPLSVLWRLIIAGSAFFLGRVFGLPCNVAVDSWRTRCWLIASS